MQIDWCTKGVLTVIAVSLAAIALKQYVSPDVVQAQSGFAGVQYATMGGHEEFFDTRTGDIWEYLNGRATSQFKLTRLGQNETQVQ
jgi:hypothetical protein